MSIGVAIFPADGTDLVTLLANSDAALYRAKRESRGSTRFFEPEMDRQLRARRALQLELNSAIKADQFTLHYQPQALIDRTITGFEALIRWKHPSRGIIGPCDFISQAEDSGTIIDIGEWVLRAACKEAASWENKLNVAINMSPVQFQHGNLCASVHSILMETGLSASRLTLEITETVFVSDFKRALHILRTLKALGVKIALDDFGKGYSSLYYLHAFPFDKIKIDRGFVNDIQKLPKSQAIVQGILGLAAGLSLPALAEGVESDDELDFLRKIHCQEVQGYLIGRPLDISFYRHVTSNDAGPVQERPAGEPMAATG